MTFSVFSLILQDATHIGFGVSVNFFFEDISWILSWQYIGSLIPAIDNSYICEKWSVAEFLSREVKKMYSVFIVRFSYICNKSVKERCNFSMSSRYFIWLLFSTTFAYSRIGLTRVLNNWTIIFSFLFYFFFFAFWIISIHLRLNFSNRSLWTLNIFFIWCVFYFFFFFLRPKRVWLFRVFTI